MEKINVTRLIPKDFRASEAIKTLRTNLIFSGTNVRAVGITSYSAAEGKSTITFQLAASFAQAGKRVLLVDADLRRSVLASRLQVKGKVDGLSHYLSGQANASELLYETDLPGMYIMFAGTRVPNSTELLGGENFAKLIPALKDAFDYVLVDTAPLGQVIDCAVMAPHLDGVALVIDTTQNSYKLERKIKAQIEKAGGKVLGAVLNQVDFALQRGYYDRYYYSYKYGYKDSEK